MAKKNRLEVFRDDAVVLMRAMDFKSAVKWSRKKIRHQLRGLHEIVEEGFELKDEEVGKLLKAVVAAGEAGDEIDVVMERPEPVKAEVESEEEEQEVEEDAELEEEETGEAEEEDLWEGDEEEEEEEEEPDEEEEEEEEEEPDEEELEEEEAQAEDETVPIEPEKPKKKRGRPPKTKTEESEVVDKPKKKRGRPKKIEEPKAKSKPKPKPKQRIVDKTFKVEVKAGDNQLTLDEAKAILGWELLDKKADGSFKDMLKTRVRLDNNAANRPFRTSLAKRYMSEILRGKWRGLNSETISVDWSGFIVSGAHRLVGFVFANQELKKLGKAKIGLDCILVTGVDPASADSVDLGQKRSGGDVLFRRRQIEGEYTERQQAKLTKQLAHATRLVWLRCGGKTVSDAPHFPNSEMLDFLEEHPTIVDAVTFAFGEDAGKERRISMYLPASTVAGLLYLMSNESEDESADVIEQAQDFVVQFAAGEDLKKSDPIYELRQLYTRQLERGGSRDRDKEIVGPWIKAWQAWCQEEKVSGKDLKVKKTEEPRLGGLDVDRGEE